MFLAQAINVADILENVKGITMGFEKLELKRESEMGQNLPKYR